MLVIPADNRILYFARDRGMFGFLSHFHPAPILLDGEVWPTVEHYYQAQKLFDPAYRQAIRDAATPAGPSGWRPCPTSLGGSRRNRGSGGTELRPGLTGTRSSWRS
jgi:hypothetical protein